MLLSHQNQVGTNKLFELLLYKVYCSTGKQGSKGEIIELKCNFFGINLMQGFQVFQYSIEFIPIIKNPNHKRFLLHQHRKSFPAYILYKATIYTSNELKELKLFSFLKKQRVIINIAKLETTLPLFHLLNLIFQKSVSFLDLQMIGENFYEPSEAVINPMLTVDKLLKNIFSNRLTFQLEI